MALTIIAVAALRRWQRPPLSERSYNKNINTDLLTGSLFLIITPARSRMCVHTQAASAVAVVVAAPLFTLCFSLYKQHARAATRDFLAGFPFTALTLAR